MKVLNILCRIAAIILVISALVHDHNGDTAKATLAMVWACFNVLVSRDDD